jgi:hypothetical protein
MMLHEYGLTGQQVQPDASYWMYCSKLHIPTIEELVAATEDKAKPTYFPEYPDPTTVQGEAIIKEEFEELIRLQRGRDDPCCLVHDKCKRIPDVCEFNSDLEEDFGCRRPISKFYNLQPFAIGQTLVARPYGEQIIRTGRGLARAHENETPGVHFRHALNFLMRQRKDWSPPFQALVWAALDIAIAGALQAAWYYKWLSPRPLTSRRERPVEYAERFGLPLNVLFDLPDELNPEYNMCPDPRPSQPCGEPKIGNTSGTPRHPAYPSGHSTYSGAASEIISFFFGNERTPVALIPHPELGSKPNTTVREEMYNMADNTGLARLWAGVHWRSDHEAGRKLGRVVACLVLQQLADMGAIEPHVNPIAVGSFNLCPPNHKWKDQCNHKEEPKCNDDKPPTTKQLMDEAQAIQAACPKHKKKKNPCDSE